MLFKLRLSHFRVLTIEFCYLGELRSIEVRHVIRSRPIENCISVRVITAVVHGPCPTDAFYPLQSHKRWAWPVRHKTLHAKSEWTAWRMTLHILWSGRFITVSEQMSTSAYPSCDSVAVDLRGRYLTFDWNQSLKFSSFNCKEKLSCCLRLSSFHFSYGIKWQKWD